MRWLIGLLLVANLLFFIWNSVRPGLRGDTALQPAGVGTLRLLSETPRGAPPPSLLNDDAAPVAREPAGATARGAATYALTAPGRADPEPRRVAEEVAGEDETAGETLPPSLLATVEEPRPPGGRTVPPVLLPDAPRSKVPAKAVPGPEPVADRAEEAVAGAQVAAIPPAGDEVAEALPDARPGEDDGADDVTGSTGAGSVEEPAPVAEAPVPPPVVTAPPDVCTRLGPYAARDEAEEASRVLAAKSRGVRLFPGTQSRVSGYFVLLPAFDTRADGLAAEKRLKAAGEKDVWLFRAGPLENAVSLGMFATRRNAEVRARQVRRKGFPVELRERLRDIEVFWLDVTHRPDEDPAGWIDDAVLSPGSACATE